MDWLARLSADGHAAYVAGAFAFALAVLLAELWALRRRWRASQGRQP